MLVSWENFNEEDITWEPVKNLPPEMVASGLRQPPEEAEDDGECYGS